MKLEISGKIFCLDEPMRLISKDSDIESFRASGHIFIENEKRLGVLVFNKKVITKFDGKQSQDSFYYSFIWRDGVKEDILFEKTTNCNKSWLFFVKNK